MSIDANPSIKEIATTFGDTPPYSMSELYGLNFSSGNAVVSGTISLSGFSNKTVEIAGFAESKIVASDADSDDSFGVNVFISSDGSTMAVGASGDDITYSNQGSVYVLENVNNTWTQRAKLTASDGYKNHSFGGATATCISISSNGSTIVVGDKWDNSSRGAVYVFEKPGAGWSDMTETIKLTVSGGIQSDSFGNSVSISNDGYSIIAGAEKAGNYTYYYGAAYIFEKVNGTWTQQAKFTASDQLHGKYFGYAVSMSGDGSKAIVGAVGDNSYTGAIYIFEKPGAGWSDMTETIKLTVSNDASADDRFGWSVSISNDGSTMAVGAIMGDITYSNQGSVYVFEKVNGTWTQRANLTASDGYSNHQLGESVSISGNGSTVVVGTIVDNSYTGAIYIFEKPGAGWSDMTETIKLTASDGISNDRFGNSVSISSDGYLVITGVPFGTITYSRQGSVYIYDTRQPSYFVN